MSATSDDDDTPGFSISAVRYENGDRMVLLEVTYWPDDGMPLTRTEALEMAEALRAAALSLPEEPGPETAEPPARGALN